jgi:hypothetical protein
MAILTRISHRSHRVPQRCHRTHDRRAICCALLVMITGCLAGTSVSIAEEPVPSESQVKAAFLINFPKYADWPAEAFAGTNSPIVIAVLGETPVTEEIQKVIPGRTVNGRKIVLKHLTSGEESGGCQILFISAAELRHSPDVLTKLKDASVLTVGESDDFLESGGIINLARRDRKIALEVNLTAAEKARIKVSSKLLNVASVVKSK